MLDAQVFLGGTCNESTWRERLITELNGVINYFNPVVDDWTEEAYQNELVEKDNSEYELYVITPMMTGVFSIAEVVDCSNKTPRRTILCLLQDDEGKSFTDSSWKSLLKVGEMVSANGGKVFNSLYDVASYFKGIDDNNIFDSRLFSMFNIKS